MSDFFQNGVVSVLHRLGSPNLPQIEADLRQYAGTNPIALVLPSLYSELSRPALKHIVTTLREVPYLNEIVISLDQASALEFRYAKEFFSVLPQRVRIVWNDGPRIQEILKTLESLAIDIGLPGKGRGCWLAFGYVLARGQSNVLALHDCDILSYTRDYLARLCYPIANPNLGYEFCKGYYSRVTDRMHGRVTRLFFTPLIRSLQRLVGPHSMLTFLDSFRYPLAGSSPWFAIWHGSIACREIGAWRSACLQRSIAIVRFAGSVKSISPMHTSTSINSSQRATLMPGCSKCALISRRRSSATSPARV